jgi:aspartate aminotransferase-like enzyme
VELLLGSGTLANDAIAAQLGLLDEPGLMLVNGEFGGRLTDHARRAGLTFQTVSFAWGEPFDDVLVEKRLQSRHYGWLWTNHCETSTGVLNNLPRLQTLCRQTGTKLVVDAISSIGLAPVDLSAVYLASGVSGKGLGSVPGIAMVFYNHPIEPQPDRIPSYLDIGLYADRAGVPFTLSSNLLYCLKAALELVELPARYEQIAAVSAWCRDQLAERGIGILAPPGQQAPAVLSMVLPPAIDSYQLGRTLLERGYQISFASRYLVARNVIQLCFFSPVRREQLWPMIRILEQAL